MKSVLFLLLLLFASEAGAGDVNLAQFLFNDKPVDELAKLQSNKEPYLFCVIHLLPKKVKPQKGIEYLIELGSQKEDAINEEEIEEICKSSSDEDQANATEEDKTKNTAKTADNSTEGSSETGNADNQTEKRNLIMRLRRRILEEQDEVTNQKQITEPNKKESASSKEEENVVNNYVVKNTKERQDIRIDFSKLFFASEGSTVIGDCIHNDSHSSVRMVNGNFCGPHLRGYSIKQIYAPDYIKYSGMANFSQTYAFNPSSRYSTVYFINKAGTMPVNFDFYENECSLDFLSNTKVLVTLKMLISVWILI